MTASVGPREGWLIVEDEMLVAILIEDAIREMGLSPLGPVPTLAAALEMIERISLEGALLDVNLGGQAIYPVADVLARRDIPFVFVTGYGADTIRPDYADRPVLHKPFEIENIQDAIRAVQQGATFLPPTADGNPTPIAPA